MSWFCCRRRTAVQINQPVPLPQVQLPQSKKIESENNIHAVALRSMQALQEAHQPSRNPTPTPTPVAAAAASPSVQVIRSSRPGPSLPAFIPQQPRPIMETQHLFAGAGAAAGIQPTAVHEPVNHRQPRSEKDFLHLTPSTEIVTSARQEKRANYTPVSGETIICKHPEKANQYIFAYVPQTFKKFESEFCYKKTAVLLRYDGPKSGIKEFELPMAQLLPIPVSALPQLYAQLKALTGPRSDINIDGSGIRRPATPLPAYEYDHPYSIEFLSGELFKKISYLGKTLILLPQGQGLDQAKRLVNEDPKRVVVWNSNSCPGEIGMFINNLEQPLLVSNCILKIENVVHEKLQSTTYRQLEALIFELAKITVLSKEPENKESPPITVFKPETVDAYIQHGFRGAIINIKDRTKAAAASAGGALSRPLGISDLNTEMLAAKLKRFGKTLTVLKLDFVTSFQGGKVQAQQRHPNDVVVWDYSSPDLWDRGISKKIGIALSGKAYNLCSFDVAGGTFKKYNLKISNAIQAEAMILQLAKFLPNVNSPDESSHYPFIRVWQSPESVIADYTKHIDEEERLEAYYKDPRCNAAAFPAAGPHVGAAIPESKEEKKNERRAAISAGPGPNAGEVPKAVIPKGPYDRPHDGLRKRPVASAGAGAGAGAGGDMQLVPVSKPQSNRYSRPFDDE